MAVERKDNLFESLLRVRNPLRILRGERSWSPLTNTEIIQVEKVPLKTIGSSHVVIPCGSVGLRYMRVVIDSSISSIEEDSVILKEEINQPNMPWSGIIRYREGKNPTSLVEV